MNWDSWKEGVNFAANVIVIVGAAIALFEWGRFRYRKEQKRMRLEEHLQDEKRKDSKKGKKGQRSLTHLVSNLGISETEVLDLAFGNKKIELKIKANAEGYADKILLMYRA